MSDVDNEAIVNAIAGNGEEIGNALKRIGIAPSQDDNMGGAANVADGLFAIADAINTLATNLAIAAETLAGKKE